MSENLSRTKIERGRALLDNKQVAEAAVLFGDVVQDEPINAEAWHFLGICRAQLGSNSEAEDCFRKSIKNGSPSAHTYHNLAVLLLDSGRLDEAAVNFREAIRRKPDFADAHVGLSNVLVRQGNDAAGAEACDRGIQSTGGTPSLFSQLGQVCARLKQFDRAEQCYRQAIHRKMTDSATYRNFGIALAMQGQLEEAARNYEKALEINDRDSEAAHNLGLILSEFGQSTKAIAMFEHVVSIDASNISALNDIARELGAQGKYREAIEIYRKLTNEHPEAVVAAQNLLCTLNYDPSLETRAIFDEHLRWSEQLGRRIAAMSAHPNLKDPTRKLRIGYVSPDFRTHSVAFFIEPILSYHDQSRYEVFCYSASDVIDATTERLRAAATHWRPIYDLDDAQTGDLIRRDQIDILIDLAGHTSGNRLTVFARKPAPIQVTYLGYPNTTSLPAIDYRLTDAITDPPEQEAFHTEQLVRLPDGFLCYRPPEHATPVGLPPVFAAGYVTFGSFNNIVKISEEVVELWSKVLQAVPKSRLILKNRSFSDDGTRNRYLALFCKNGVSSERVVLMGWIPAIPDHLSLYNRVDISLDTFPYNGTTTTCEALWMGVPVIALEGNRHAARVGTSLLTQVGHAELIAHDLDNYIRLAVELARDTDRLMHLRSNLRQHIIVSPLCDAPAFTQRLETAYRDIWRTWCTKPSIFPDSHGT